MACSMILDGMASEACNFYYVLALAEPSGVPY
jgi:hypothetical protein